MTSARVEKTTTYPNLETFKSRESLVEDIDKSLKNRRGGIAGSVVAMIRERPVRHLQATGTKEVSVPQQRVKRGAVEKEHDPRGERV